MIKFKNKLRKKKDIVSVCFRVDANETLGLGHLSRCRSLMLAFSRVAKCHFSIISKDKKLVKNFITNVDFDLYDTKYCFCGQSFDLLIVDAPDIYGSRHKQFREISGLIACIDDEGAGLQCQDVLVRPNLLNLPKPANLKIASKNYWAGRDYIILHPDFTLWAGRKRRKKKKATELIVCFGGSDPGGLTLRVIPLLKGLEKSLAIKIVLGAAFPWRKKVLSMLQNEPCFSVDCNVLNMAQNFWNADVALISGGTLLYEACSLGIPSVVISQNEGQEKEAKICHNAGAVVNLGINEVASDDKILENLQQMIGNIPLMEKMAKKGPKIVSPDGTMFIISKLLSAAKGVSIK